MYRVEIIAGDEYGLCLERRTEYDLNGLTRSVSYVVMLGQEYSIDCSDIQKILPELLKLKLIQL